MRRVIHIAPGASATHAHGSRRRIDVHVLDGRKVDDQAVVADSQAASIMASAADGHAHIVLPPETYRGNHVGHVGAFGDQARFAADHRVVDLARLVVTRVRGFDQLAPELSFQLSNSFLLH